MHLVGLSSAAVRTVELIAGLDAALLPTQVRSVAVAQANAPAAMTWLNTIDAFSSLAHRDRSDLELSSAICDQRDRYSFRHSQRRRPGTNDARRGHWVIATRSRASYDSVAASRGYLHILV